MTQKELNFAIYSELLEHCRRVFVYVVCKPGVYTLKELQHITTKDGNKYGVFGFENFEDYEININVDTFSCSLLASNVFKIAYKFAVLAKQGGKNSAIFERSEEIAQEPETIAQEPEAAQESDTIAPAAQDPETIRPAVSVAHGWRARSGRRHILRAAGVAACAVLSVLAILGTKSHTIASASADIPAPVMVPEVIQPDTLAAVETVATVDTIAAADTLTADTIAPAVLDIIAAADTLTADTIAAEPDTLAAVETVATVDTIAAADTLAADTIAPAVLDTIAAADTLTADTIAAEPAALSDDIPAAGNDDTTSTDEDTDTTSSEAAALPLLLFPFVMVRPKNCRNSQKYNIMKNYTAPAPTFADVLGIFGQYVTAKRAEISAQVTTAAAAARAFLAGVWDRNRATFADVATGALVIATGAAAVYFCALFDSVNY